MLIISLYIVLQMNSPWIWHFNKNLPKNNPSSELTPLL